MTLSNLVHDLSYLVVQRPVPDAPRPVVLPDDDDIIPATLETLGHAEGQSFAIEYIDSARRPSTRRITVYGIVAGANGVPLLVAQCHERKAQRSFRVDRIQCFIDYDGEVYSDVPAFLVENFGMAAEHAERKGNDAVRWKNILETVKHDAVILAALARADGATIREEVEIARDHLSRVAENDGMMLEEAEILAIYRYASRLRPTELAIERALKHVAGLQPRHTQRLLIAAASVVDADGKRHPREIDLINAVAVELIGAKII